MFLGDKVAHTKLDETETVKKETLQGKVVKLKDGLFWLNQSFLEELSMNYGDFWLLF